MNKAHFSRVDRNTTWNILYNTINSQIKNGCKPIPFAILTEIYITEIEFDELSLSLAKPHDYYFKYTDQSVANSSGIWKCIFIKCVANSKNVLLYTAGNIYPLYASILN